MLDTDYDPIEFGAYTRKERQRLGWSRAELARRCGLHERTIRNVENGQRSQEATRLLIVGALGAQYPPITGHERPRKRRRGWIGVVALGVVLLGATWWIWRIALDDAIPAFKGSEIEVRDAVLHHILWKKEYPSPIAQAKVLPWHNSPPQLGVAVTDYPGNPGLEVVDLHRGTRVWTYMPAEETYARTFPESLLTGGNLQCFDFAPVDLNGTGKPFLAVIFRHSMGLPSSVEILDSGGALASNYQNFGHVNALHAEDLDEDGKEELLVLATNNYYGGPSVILLDDACCWGASADSLVLSTCGRPDSARIRVVLPGLDRRLMAVLKAPRLDPTTVLVYAESGETRIRVGAGNTETKINVVFDASLHPLSVIVPDITRTALELAVDTGVLPASVLTDDYWNAWLARLKRFEAGHWPPSNGSS